ncbi:MAG: cytochrome P450 [Nannocystaceae bacterium]
MLQTILDRALPRRPPAGAPAYPGPTPLPIVGNAIGFARGMIATHEDCWRRYGDFYVLHIGNKKRIFVTLRPEDAEKILITERESFSKGTTYDGVRLLFGQGLVTSEGDVWRVQRRVAQPSFNRVELAAMAGPMAAATGRMLAEWDRRLRVGDDINIHAELLKVTMWIIGETLFGLDLSGEVDASARSFAVALEELSHRGNELIQLPLWLPTPANRRLRGALRLLTETVDGIIDRRRRAGDVGQDLLGAFLRARDDEGRPLPHEQIRDQVTTFFLAGHETTAIALSWTYHLLGQDPEVMEQVEAEVDAVLGGRVPTAEDVARLTYTRSVFLEALRLYPPAWSGGRDVVRETTLSGYPIPPGVIVSYVPYLIHRHPEFWPDPLRFDPSRFAPGGAGERSRGAYLPFALGPRMCIGNHFSLLEGPLILAMLVQRYRFRPTPGAKVGQSFQITLRPDPGVFLRVAAIRDRPAEAYH